VTSLLISAKLNWKEFCRSTHL